jgi:hypothetical protein
MAYTLGDPFRPLRLILRVNGFLVGIVLGLLLLVTPRTLLLAWGLFESGSLWPLRLAGAGQIGLGIFFFLTASQDYLSKLTLITTVLTNGVLALVLLTAYLQQELTQLSTVGQLLFVLVFLLYLLGAVIPLRYVRGSN